MDPIDPYTRETQAQPISDFAEHLTALGESLFHPLADFETKDYLRLMQAYIASGAAERPVTCCLENRRVRRNHGPRPRDAKLLEPRCPFCHPEDYVG
jgi:hypothetical protein